MQCENTVPVLVVDGRNLAPQLAVTYEDSGRPDYDAYARSNSPAWSTGVFTKPCGLCFRVFTTPLQCFGVTIFCSRKFTPTTLRRGRVALPHLACPYKEWRSNNSYKAWWFSELSKIFPKNISPAKFQKETLLVAHRAALSFAGLLSALSSVDVVKFNRSSAFRVTTRSAVQRSTVTAHIDSTAL